MYELLFEYWESDDDTAIFGPVSESFDKNLKFDDANSKFVYEVFGNCHEDAYQQHYKLMDFGEFRTVPGVTDQNYSESEYNEQQQYLSLRVRPDQ